MLTLFPATARRVMFSPKNMEKETQGTNLYCFGASPGLSSPSVSLARNWTDGILQVIALDDGRVDCNAKFVVRTMLSNWSDCGK
jgi:hypothetical protein